MEHTIQTATFGAGCFWGVQSAFDETAGVVSTMAGYMGGDESSDKVTYKEVCTDTTGHAEVVQITYDPAIISYETLLGLFFDLHDPTTLNRQGPDVGSQYRSVIFYHTAKQKASAIAYKEEIQKKLGKDKKVVTEITKAGRFYPAEDYHQKYLAKRGLASCHR